MFFNKGKPLKCMGVTTGVNSRSVLTGRTQNALTVKDDTKYNSPMTSKTSYFPPVAGQVFLEFKSATIY